jgi:hypothetical protein
MGKFGDTAVSAANRASAEQALKRALAINPDLSLAHNLYAQFEVEAGRAREAMVRLLDRVRASPSEPELFAGLVHACRYCGLLDASEAAEERARRLDPHIVTSIAQTYLMRRDWARAIAADTSSTPIAKVLALVYSGNRAEAVSVLHGLIARGLPQSLQALLEGLLDFAEGNGARLLSAIHRMVDSQVGSDPEAMYHWSGSLCESGDHDGALGLLERSLDAGYYPAWTLVNDPRFDPVRGSADFRSLVRRAEEMQRRAVESFRAADGPRLLGLPQG